MADYTWWQTGVVYQIYPRSFKDVNGDGVGDLAGIIEKLDYLAETLGVDAIWLSPFYASPMADFGYDVADYTDVDPLFGDLATFDRLVAEAHARDLKVIVDYVPNHSSDQHPWFQASRSSRENPKRDWYVWRDPKPDGSPPNNWLSVFGGSAWTYDEATGQYYLHKFLKEQPDLNWRNPEVKAAMLDVLRFWMDRGVDGFRIDTAHYIMKDPALRDNPPNPERGGYHKDIGAYDTQFHIHDKGHADVHAVYQEIRALVDGHDEAERVTIGEIHIYDPEAWVRFYGEALDELHMPFNFSLLMAPWTAAGIRASVEAMEAALPEGAWPNYVLGNHDESRLATRVGRRQARVAATLLLTLRGTPTLYYGDELGLEDVPIPPEKEQDPWGLRVPGLSRDPARTPMPWEASPSAGFSDAPPDDLWLPLGTDADTCNVATERSDPASMLNFYRRLLRLRRERPALHRGSYRSLSEVPEPVFAYVREDGEDRVLVLLNFASQEARVELPEWASDLRWLLSSDYQRTESAGSTILILGPDEAVVLG